ncbi:pentatricopeptide repeat-containing protein [Tripterygium wilfordii]|uniref:Pentatricopeptide repeat-containing protein n=1 Tax=Tripterygium wilfordii TaxID=458696 RepID=A0A7J7CVS7_TRIWF|nr:pentatricopeptide repeat-containing protein [Tripterygium wilfordii]
MELTIAGCVENGMVDEAFGLFREICLKRMGWSITFWNATISGFVRYERVEEASRLLKRCKGDCDSLYGHDTWAKKNQPLFVAKAILASIYCKKEEQSYI